MKAPKVISNKKDLLAVITEKSVYERFLGVSINTDDFYYSPFRGKPEEYPSLNFFHHKATGELYFKDFGGDGYSGDCIQFVQYYLRLNFYQALEAIQSELQIGNYTHFRINKGKVEEQQFKQIVVIDRPFVNYDKVYWQSYGIPSKSLKKYHIIPAQEVQLNTNKGIYSIFNYYKNPIYAIHCNQRFKIYRPFEKPKRKWISNLVATDIVGYAELPKNGEIVIISKSAKDVAFLDSLFFPAICTISENVLPSEKIIQDLKERFTHIVSFLDNDSTGLKAMNKLYERYNIPFIHTPFNTKKDISDYRKTYGKTDTEVLLNKLLGNFV